MRFEMFVTLFLFCVCMYAQEVKVIKAVEDNQTEPKKFLLHDDTSKIIIGANGKGKKINQNGRAVNFSLPIENSEIISLYYANYNGDILLIYEEQSFDGGNGGVILLDNVSLKKKWKSHISGFNVGEPFLYNDFLYLTAIGWVGKLNIKNGKYIWQKDDLYYSDIYNSFDKPFFTTQDRNTIAFTEKNDSFSETRKIPCQVLVIEDKTGKIINGAPTNISFLSGETNSVKIGDQIWMTENLSVSQFRNGDPIPEATNDEEWCTAGFEKKPAWCYYENDYETGVKNGKLYNWYAVTDKRGLAPKGWHIPSKREFESLIHFVYSNWDGGGAMIKVHSNESGFSALLAGRRNCNSNSFDFLDKEARFWSSTEEQKSVGLFMILGFRSNYIDLKGTGKDYGLSVRCIKN